MKYILHIDVNNAFLSWEATERLKIFGGEDLRKICSVVAGDPATRTGIILAKSPVAKKYGVVTGEPIFKAKQKCPSLVILHPHFQLYEKYSYALYTILTKYSDKIEKFSVDEYFIEHIPLLGSPESVAQKIKDEVESSLAFTVNIGISTNKLLAKMASDFEKPNKIHTLYKQEIPLKMWPLDVSELFMLGKSSAKKLNKMGIKTIGDLAHTDRELLKYHFKSHGITMYNSAWGIASDEIVSTSSQPKSISNSKTTPADISTTQDIMLLILQLVDTVCIRLRREQLLAKTFTVELKTASFIRYSASMSICYATNVSKEIAEICKNILYNMKVTQPIRMVGIALSNLTSENQQLSMFDNEIKKYSALDTTIDSLLAKLGGDKVTRASLITKKTK